MCTCAGLGPWCKPRPPCFPATNEDYCTKEICPHVCEMNEIVSNGAYCKKPKKGGEPIWLCCCPPARLGVVMGHGPSGLFTAQ